MPKRKADTAGLNADQIDTVLTSATRGVTTYDELFNMVEQLRAITSLLKAQKKGDEGELKIVQASKLRDITEVSDRTGLKFIYGMPEHSWKLVGLKPKEEFKSSFTWLESALIQFRSSPFWQTASCEALTRTMVDLVLFDRMMLIHNQDAARKLRLVGEKSIQTNCRGGKMIISGTADYVLGYPYADGRSGLESMYIAIETKTPGNTPKAIHQLAAYLIGMQQHRKNNNKIVHIVYGIATDGLAYRFLRLDEQMRLQVSREYQISDDDDKYYIYSFIDSILEAAIQSSPHTTPMKSFPDHSAKWTYTVERKLFVVPEELKSKLPENWEDWIVWREENDEDSDEDSFTISGGSTPTRSNVALHQKFKSTE